VQIQSRAQSCLSIGAPSQCYNLQAGDEVEMPQIGGCHAIAELESRNTDKQIGKGQTNPLGRILAIQSSRMKRHRNRDGMDGNGTLEFLQKLLSGRPAFRSVGPNSAVREFHESHHGNGDVRKANLGGQRRECLSRVLAFAFRGNQHAGIENQSHDGGFSGSRCVSTASLTSRAKASSTTAVESSGSNAIQSAMDRRGGTGVGTIAAVSLPLSMMTSSPA